MFTRKLLLKNSNINNKLNMDSNNVSINTYFSGKNTYSFIDTKI